MQYYRMTIQELRGRFKWTTYGRRGGSTPRTIYLKNMMSDHLKRCIKNTRISSATRNLFNRELAYRNRKGLTDADIKKSMRRTIRPVRTRPLNPFTDNVENDPWTIDIEF